MKPCSAAKCDYAALIAALERCGAIWRGQASKVWWFDSAMWGVKLSAAELRAVADELDRRNTLNTVILPPPITRIDEVV